jgi:hypothetical protein
MGKKKQQQKPKTSEQVRAAKELSEQRMKVRKEFNAATNESQRQKNLALVKWLLENHKVEASAIEGKTPADIRRFAKRNFLLGGYDETKL